MAAMVIRMPTANSVRGPERPPRRHLALFADEADDERDAGQMAGAEQDAQDAPDERRAERDERRAFDGVAQVGEELFHVSLWPTSTPSSFHLPRMSSLPKKPVVPEQFLAVRHRRRSAWESSRCRIACPRRDSSTRQ